MVPEAHGHADTAAPPRNQRAAAAAALRRTVFPWLGVAALIVASVLSSRDRARAIGANAGPAPVPAASAEGILGLGRVRELGMPESAVPSVVAPPPAAQIDPPATPTPTPTLISPEKPAAGAPPPTATPAPPLPAALAAIIPAPPGTRDKRLWPFAVDSIWNMPIGTGAVYVPAGIGPAKWFTVDNEFFVFPEPTDPVRPFFTNGVWGTGRCAAATYEYSINLPDDFVVDDASPPWTPNNVAAILSLDGRTLKQMNPVSRCEAGGPLTAGWMAPDQDIYGPGILGGHGGSGMSSIGGSVRRGELIGPAPIRHALKVNLWGHRWLSSESGGHRWPAVAADSFYNDPGNSNMYDGPLPPLRMGSLLAIPRDIDVNALGLQTDAARKIAWTMQNYGAYVVDDTTWDSHALDVEAGVPAEFRAAYGYSIEGTDGPWYDDMMKIFAALSVIDDNGPSSIGGGGAPLQPLAPPIGN